MDIYIACDNLQIERPEQVTGVFSVLVSLVVFYTAYLPSPSPFFLLFKCQNDWGAIAWDIETSTLSKLQVLISHTTFAHFHYINFVFQNIFNYQFHAPFLIAMFIKDASIKIIGNENPHILHWEKT